MANELTTTGAALAKTPSLPRAVVSALTTSLEWEPGRARRELAGYSAEDLQSLAATAQRALAPADRTWLHDRLSTIWLAMTWTNDEDRATAWLHETARLVADIPQDILDAALDAVVMSAEKGYPPTVGAIRAHADEALSRRRQIAQRLAGVAGLAEHGSLQKTQNIDGGFDPTTRCTPEEAAEIKAELPDVPAVDPVTKESAIFQPNEYSGPRAPSFDTTGMSIAEIFAMRDRLRAQAIMRSEAA